MVNSLQNSVAFASEPSRQLALEIIAEQLDQPATMRSHPTLRGQLIDIVRTYARNPDGLRVLVEVVGRFDPMSFGTARLHQLLDEWQAAPTFNDDDWVAFRSALGDVVLPNMTELFHAATRNRRHRPPAHCKTAWHFFVHLADLNAGPDCLPPCMIFLERVAALLPASTGQELRMRNRRLASEHGLTTLMNEIQMREHDRVPRAAHTAYLIIQLEADGIDPERYTLSHWSQWDRDGWHPERGEDRIVSILEIENEVEKLIFDMETAWAEAVETVTLEFILPWELINVPVDWWRKESHSSRPTPLAMDYPVVIRSLERLRTPRWHRAWHVRWQRLNNDPESALPYWSRPAGNDYHSMLEADLKSDPRYACLILSEPPLPGRSGRTEIETALRAGLPVIIWHRQDCGTPEFREAVQQMLAGETLAQLPARARKLRGEALRLDPEDRDDHIGRHLTMMWDDPERQPEASRSYGAPEEGIRR